MDLELLVILSKTLTVKSNLILEHPQDDLKII
jgi:hypothetical protein